MSSTAQVGPANPALRDPNPSWGWIRVAFWICVVIAVAVVVRRTVALAYPPGSVSTQMAGLDAAFASHSILTLVHILPAMVFVLLLPLVYSRRFVGANWLQRLIFGLGIVVAVSAYAMNRYAIGGWVERSAVLFFNTLFLFSLVRAWQFRAVHSVLGMRWLTRAVRHSSGHCHHSPCDGRLLRHKPPDSPEAESILWDCVLDWLRHQHGRN